MISTKKTNLLKEFNLAKKTSKKEILKDYEVFPDKKLLDDLRLRIIQDLIDKDIPKEEITSDYINNIVDSYIEGFDLNNMERNYLFNLINDEVNGYGPLNALLNDDNITEIMVNSPSEVYVEIDGKMIKDESVSFIDEQHIIRTIQHLIAPSGKTIDFNNPIVNFRLDNKVRVNAVIPPLSTKGPVMSIHKYNQKITSIDDFIRVGALTPYMARFLLACVESKLNILVSGTSSSGKTTLLNILGGFINENERIITIEDEAELTLNQKNIVSLETSLSDISTKDLISNAQKMRPDRMIFGQIKSQEAFDILQLMYTGQKGILTSVYASTPGEALKHLEALALSSKNFISQKTIKQYLASSIDIIVQIDKLLDGRRRITNICEINTDEDGSVVLSDIFTFTQRAIRENNEIDGEYKLIEKEPKVLEKINNSNIHYVDDMFRPNQQIDESTMPKLKNTGDVDG